MPYKMKKGATAMYGPKAMKEKGAMAMTNPSKKAKKVAKASGLREESKKLLGSARKIAGSEMLYGNKKAQKLEMKSMRKHDKAKKLNRKYGYGEGAMAMKEGPMAMKKEGAMAYKKGPMAMSGEKYDAKQAYNKKLTASARLHYLENERHDKTHMQKVQPHKRGATAMHKGPKAMKPKGPMAMKFDSSTDKGIKGLGSAKGEKKAKNI